MVSWTALGALNATTGNCAMCRPNLGAVGGSLSRRPSHVCSKIRSVSWSALETEHRWTMRCADRFGSSCGSLSRLRLHTCAVKSDGQLVCFGCVKPSDKCDVPTELGAVVAVSAGYFQHRCAVRSDGQLVCFG